MFVHFFFFKFLQSTGVGRREKSLQKSLYFQSVFHVVFPQSFTFVLVFRLQRVWCMQSATCSIGHKLISVYFLYKICRANHLMYCVCDSFRQKLTKFDEGFRNKIIYKSQRINQGQKKIQRRKWNFVKATKPKTCLGLVLYFGYFFVLLIPINVDHSFIS